jgi:hypothetical protein
VHAVSASDVWAVGSHQDDSGTLSALIEHWDGSAWTVMSSPSPGAFDELISVTGTSATDAWAVGFTQDTSRNTTTLIEHWDGTSWTIVSSPSPGTNPELRSVAATSATDAWAVGRADTSTGMAPPGRW